MNNVRIQIPEIFSVEEVARFRDEAYSKLSKEPVKFELDFSRCQFIDSTGLGTLVSIYKKCKERGGDVELYHLNADVMKIIKMTRLDHVFTIK